jgi:hypothetical protein
MSEKIDLRILLACSRPLVLKVQRWIATLDEEARPYLESAADRLREVAESGDIEARGNLLIFKLYPPAPDSVFLKKALESVIPLKHLNGDSAPEPIDVLRPGEEIEVVRRGLGRIRREIQVVVHGAATLPEINNELLYAEPGFDVLHFIFEHPHNVPLASESWFGRTLVHRRTHDSQRRNGTFHILHT